MQPLWSDWRRHRGCFADACRAPKINEPSKPANITIFIISLTIYASKESFLTIRASENVNALPKLLTATAFASLREGSRCAKSKLSKNAVPLRRLLGAKPYTDDVSARAQNYGVRDNLKP
jgi:hypothetical protein